MHGDDLLAAVQLQEQGENPAVKMVKCTWQS